MIAKIEKEKFKHLCLALTGTCPSINKDIYAKSEIESDFVVLKKIGVPHECIDELKSKWGTACEANIEYHRKLYKAMYDEVVSLGCEHLNMEDFIRKTFLHNNLPIFYQWASNR